MNALKAAVIGTVVIDGPRSGQVSRGEPPLGGYLTKTAFSHGLICDMHFLKCRSLPVCDGFTPGGPAEGDGGPFEAHTAPLCLGHSTARQCPWCVGATRKKK